MVRSWEQMAVMSLRLMYITVQYDRFMWHRSAPFHDFKIPAVKWHRNILKTEAVNWHGNILETSEAINCYRTILGMLENVNICSKLCLGCVLLQTSLSSVPAYKAWITWSDFPMLVARALMDSFQFCVSLDSFMKCLSLQWHLMMWSHCWIFLQNVFTTILKQTLNTISVKNKK